MRRGYVEVEAARRFLRPRLSQLDPPGRLPDLDRAADRVERAIGSGETILVHGDYDVDGLSAAALLVRALRELGGRTHGFVPHRTRDGYDLGEAGLEAATAAGATLIVTADCGITAVEAVERAARRGIDVVVTDHHRPGARLPAAAAVVNPAREDAPGPDPELAGVGVAYRLVEELFRRAGLPEERRNAHLDLVALGTVADQAPLVGENRVLARMGLRALERSRKAGIRALLDAVRRPGDGPLRASDVGFRLGPRLNAVGRVGSAERGLRLLLTEDPVEAARLVRLLESENRRRRTEDRRVVREAEERLRTAFEPDRDRAVVLWAEGWHPGVLGIAASRLAERYCRPTALVAVEGDVGRGSARSVEGFHLFRALQGCASALERFGGHAMAAGFEVRRERLETFARLFRAEAERGLAKEQLVHRLRPDLAVGVETLTPELVRFLEHLGPFGSGNPRPTVRVDGVEIRRVERVGEDGRHLRAVLTDGGRSLRAIGFGMGERADDVEGSALYDAVVEVREAWWRGRCRPEGRLLDVRPAQAGERRA